VQWGRRDCSNGHKTEYWGIIMSQHYSQKKAAHVCVDWNREWHIRSWNGNHDGALLYATEMEGGSSNEAQYPHNREIGCAVCTPASKGVVYSRWGSRSCAGGSTKLYDGMMAGEHYTHNGGGYQYLCMHPQPQWPPGYSNGNQNGNLLYGTEYQNQGTSVGNKNHDRDAACAVCQQMSSTAVYVQWGRQSCAHGHTTEYAGLIMASHYSQRKSQHVCVDFAREWHAGNHNGDHNGALLYATEMEGGSSDEALYPHNREIGCAVCSV